MDNSNTKSKDEKYREWSKPIINKLDLSLTKGGVDPKNNENSNFYMDGGMTGS